VTGVHTASIHPGPTCGQGTSPMARSVPSATAGVAAGVAAGADAEADALGLDCTAVEFEDDEQPVSNSDAAATMPRPARQAAACVETCFKTVPFVRLVEP
ncbi:MAG: hypothetical protein JWR34_4179, partial [Mycobacterium sp.]|nr:hypothetical protein [Mycobacterium sp.]